MSTHRSVSAPDRRLSMASMLLAMRFKSTCCRSTRSPITVGRVHGLRDVSVTWLAWSRAPGEDRRLGDDGADIERRLFHGVVLEQLAVALNHVVGALAGIDDIQEGRPHFRHIRRAAGEPPQARPRVRDDRRQRLTDFVRDRSRKLAERGQPRHAGEVSLGVVQRMLGHLPLGDVRAGADHAHGASLVPHRRAARQEPADAAVLVNIRCSTSYCELLPLEMITRRAP